MPGALEIHRVRLGDGRALRVLEWPGADETLLLLHPNGFGAGVFAPLAAELASRDAYRASPSTCPATATATRRGTVRASRSGRSPMTSSRRSTGWGPIASRASESRSAAASGSSPTAPARV